jgi:hypothetical protein
MAAIAPTVLGQVDALPDAIRRGAFPVSRSNPIIA